MTFTPTDDDKAGAISDHVFYEVQQFAYLCAFLHPLGFIHDDLTTRGRIVDPALVPTINNNARVEAMLLHARILLWFFEKRERTDRKDDDDVLAADYGFPVTRVAIDKTFRSRLNKDLAHLAYDRAKRQGSEKNWQFRDLVRLLVRCHEFATHVVDKVLNETDEQAKAAWHKLATTISNLIAAEDQNEHDGNTHDPEEQPLR